MPDRLDSIRPQLEAHGQTHLLRFFDEIAPAQQRTLLDQLASIDFAALAALASAHVGATARQALPESPVSAPYYPHPERLGADRLPDAAVSYDPGPSRREGEAAIAAGRVAAFAVAGGQGTRLGWKGPKGTFPATPVTGKPLFRCFAEQLLAVQRRHDIEIPWYIMTSAENDAETRAFFLDNNCFGLVRKNIFMFPQAMMPAVDAATGQVLLAAKHAVALNPDGHGGSIGALRHSGALEDMQRRGIEHISYFQVDNPTTRVIDPLFIGLHAAAPDSSGEMSTKMVLKRTPDEKLGVLVHPGAGPQAGRTMVIEYFELPDDLATQTDATGGLSFAAGSMAVHVMGVAFVDRLTGGEGGALPFHAARKKVSFLDVESGRRIVPDTENAIKFERFVFDALPHAESSLVLEVDRVEEFAPIKDASTGQTPAWSHQVQCERAARWLEANGVRIPRDGDGRALARLEISPLTALESADLASAELPEAVKPGEAMVL